MLCLLARLKPNMPVQTDMTLQTGVDALLRAGDANGDNACDVFDLDVLIQAFDTTPDHPQWIAGADGSRHVMHAVGFGNATNKERAEMIDIALVVLGRDAIKMEAGIALA